MGTLERLTVVHRRLFGRLARAEAWAIAFAIAVSLDAGTANAQTGPSRVQPPVIDLGEDFIIEGHVQKPEAFYFLRRTPFGFVIRTLDEDFLGEVVRAVTSEPF